MDYVLFIYFCVIFSNDVGAAFLLIAALLSVWLCYSVLVGGGCSCDADNDDVFNYGGGKYVSGYRPPRTPHRRPIQKAIKGRMVVGDLKVECNGEQEQPCTVGSAIQWVDIQPRKNCIL